jgi:hypothetical protein
MHSTQQLCAADFIVSIFPSDTASSFSYLTDEKDPRGYIQRFEQGNERIRLHKTHCILSTLTLVIISLIPSVLNSSIDYSAILPRHIIVITKCHPRFATFSILAMSTPTLVFTQGRTEG